MSRLPIRVALLALLGFAVFPACFWSQGTRLPPEQARRLPAAGPDRPSGGQFLAAAELPAAECACLARSALETRGWTVHASTRGDELIGSRFHNIAYLRWNVAGRWWCRVEQQSDLRNGLRVPPWDHPWEALRLLHLALPDSGPAEGWRAWRDDDRPALDLPGLRQALIDPAPVDAERLADLAVAAAELPAPDANEARLRFDMLLTSVLRDPDRAAPGLLAASGAAGQRLPSVLEVATAERRDPYTAMPATEDSATEGRPAPAFPAADGAEPQHLLLLQRQWQVIACWNQGDAGTGDALAQGQWLYRGIDELIFGDKALKQDSWKLEADWRAWWQQRGRPWVDARADAVRGALP